MSAVVSVKNWERYQHYKDRDPPWVKFYRDLLTSESWVLGSDLSRVVQSASILLAPRYSNRIPLRFDLLKRVMSLDCSEQKFAEAIDHLVRTEFLEIQQVTEPAKTVEQSASSVLATCTTETEQRRDRAEKSREERSVAPERDRSPVERVFEHWRREHKHPRAVLDAKRRRAIEGALRAYDEPTLCESISGYLHSPHHMGQNEQRTTYDEITLFLRDAEHIDRGLRFARAPPPQQQSAVEKARAKLLNGGNHGGDRESETGVGEVAGVLRRLAAS